MALISSIILILATIFLFSASCLIMTTDAQGVLVFVFTLPLMILFLYLSVYLSKKMQKKLKKLVVTATGLVAFFIVMFFVSVIGDIFSFYPNTLLKLLENNFISVMGVTPRAYFQEKNDILKLLEKQRLKNGDDVIDFKSLKTGHEWDRICFLPPYTDAKTAIDVLGFDWKIERYSSIPFSDNINALVFAQDKMIIYVVNLPRSFGDFSKYDHKCVPRKEAVFVKKINQYGLKDYYQENLQP